jgi:hypothetical protein
MKTQRKFNLDEFLNEIARIKLVLKQEWGVSDVDIRFTMEPHMLDEELNDEGLHGTT